jgi:hypothetical protein
MCVQIYRNVTHYKSWLEGSMKVVSLHTLVWLLSVIIHLVVVTTATATTARNGGNTRCDPVCCRMVNQQIVPLCYERSVSCSIQGLVRFQCPGGVYSVEDEKNWVQGDVQEAVCGTASLTSVECSPGPGANGRPQCSVYRSECSESALTAWGGCQSISCTVIACRSGMTAVIISCSNTIIR